MNKNDQYKFKWNELSNLNKTIVQIVSQPLNERWLPTTKFSIWHGETQTLVGVYTKNESYDYTMRVENFDDEVVFVIHQGEEEFHVNYGDISTDLSYLSTLVELQKKHTANQKKGVLA